MANELIARRVADQSNMRWISGTVMAALRGCPQAKKCGVWTRGGTLVVEVHVADISYLALGLYHAYVRRKVTQWILARCYVPCPMQVVVR